MKLTTTLVSLSFFSSYTAAQDVNPYKIAVIENTKAVKYIQSGNMGKAQQLLDSVKSRSPNQYAHQMSLCVLKLVEKDDFVALNACDSALRLVLQTTQKVSDPLAEKVTSYAYSNRALAKYRLGNITGAISDLKAAASKDNNDVVANNVKVMSLWSKDNTSR